MEGLRSDSAAARYISERLGDEAFTVIDVGCSGGIDRIWRLFGERLRAFGFDPNVDECARLAAAETLPGAGMSMPKVCSHLSISSQPPSPFEESR